MCNKLAQKKASDSALAFPRERAKILVHRQAQSARIEVARKADVSRAQHVVDHARGFLSIGCELRDGVDDIH